VDNFLDNLSDWLCMGSG